MPKALYMTPPMVMQTINDAKIKSVVTALEGGRWRLIEVPTLKTKVYVAPSKSADTAASRATLRSVFFTAFVAVDNEETRSSAHLRFLP